MVIPTRYTRVETEEIERARRILGLPSRSALIREAVRSKIEEVKRMRVVEMSNVPVEEASRMIAESLRKKPGVHYVSELIEELGVEPGTAFEAVKKLMQAGRAKVREEK